MNAVERNYVFVTLGAGDAFTAIRGLINIIAAKDIRLHPHLVQLCRSWVNGYAFHDHYEHLCGLIEDRLRPNAIQASRTTRRASRPKPPPLVTVRPKLRTRRAVRAVPVEPLQGVDGYCGG